MALELRFKLDRNGDTAEMRVNVLSDAPFGAMGAAGLGLGAELPEGQIDAAGNLKALSGAPYLLPMARLETDPEPPLHRLIIRREGQIVATVPFVPKAGAVQGFLDINEQLRLGGPPAAAGDSIYTLAELKRRIEQILEAGGVDGRVRWRFNSRNNVILDGINDTTVTLVHEDNFLNRVTSMTQVTGLNTALAAKADLENGKHKLDQYAAGVYRKEHFPATEADMLKLNAYMGDVAHVGAQRFLMVESSPAARRSWLALDALGQVTSVNGYTGIVSLTAADVGGVPSGTTAVQLGGAAASHTHSASEVSGKEVWLQGYVQAGEGLSIAETAGRLVFSLAGTGNAVAWVDISGKPATFPTTWAQIADKPSSFPVSWVSVSDKPDLYPTNPANVSGFDAAARGAVDMALYSGTLTNFGKAAADAVGARIVSDSIAVTATGNGQIRLEASGSGTGGGIALEEADGQPSLTGVQKLIIDGGTLTAVDAKTAKLTVKVGATSGGEITMSYTPKYRRSASVTSPLPYRTEIICRAVVRTAFAQADGRDIRVYTDAGSVRPSNVISALPGTNYVDYTVVWSETLDASQTRTYEIRYGDEYAPERPLRMDELYRLLNRPTRVFNGVQITSDPGLKYRSPNFGTAGAWIWSTADEIQVLPATLMFAGQQITQIKHTSTKGQSGAGWDNTFQLLDAAGSVIGGFGIRNGTYISSPNSAAGAYDAGSRTMHVLPDGLAWDIGSWQFSDRAAFTLRYRHPGVWTLTAHDQTNGSNLLTYTALYVGTAAVPLAPITGWGAPVATDPATWASVSIGINDTARATVGDEQVYTPPVPTP